MIHTSKIISTEDIGNHYDELFDIYLELWGRHLHHGIWSQKTKNKEEAAENLTLYISKKLQADQYSNILDIGCGYGETDRFLVSKFQSKITAYTVSKRQYNYARTQESTNIKYICKDWLKSKISTPTFSHAIAIESLAHIDNKQLFFKKLNSVIKPQGHVLIMAWTTGNNLNFFEKNIMEMICNDSCLPSMDSSNNYIQLAIKNGFEVLEEKDLSKKVMKTWRIAIQEVTINILKKNSLKKYLNNKSNKNRIFLRGVFLIYIAYHIGCMKYSFIHLKKPS